MNHKCDRVIWFSSSIHCCYCFQCCIFCHCLCVFGLDSHLSSPCAPQTNPDEQRRTDGAIFAHFQFTQVAFFGCMYGWPKSVHFTENCVCLFNICSSPQNKGIGSICFEQIWSKSFRSNCGSILLRAIYVFMQISKDTNNANSSEPTQKKKSKSLFIRYK